MLGLILTILLVPTPALYDDPVADRLIRSAMDSTYMLQLDDARTAAQDSSSAILTTRQGF